MRSWCTAGPSTPPRSCRRTRRGRRIPPRRAPSRPEERRDTREALIATGPAYGTRLLRVLSKGPIALTPGLIEAAASADQSLAAVAAERLGRFGVDAAAAVPSLAAAAEKQPDDKVRTAASAALARMGPEGTAALRRLLVSADARTRSAALSALSIESGDAGALIGRALGDPDPSVRGVALGRIALPIRTGDGFDGVCANPRHPDDEQFAGVRPLQIVRDTSGREAARVRETGRVRETVRVFLMSLPAATADRLRALLVDQSEDVRKAAAGALAMLGCVLRDRGGEVAGALTGMLSDRAPAVRAAAVGRLADLARRDLWPPASTLPALMEALARETGEDRRRLLNVIAGVDAPASERSRVVETVITQCLALTGWSCDGVAEALKTRPESGDIAVDLLAARLRQPARDGEGFGLFRSLQSTRPAYRRALEQIFAGRRDALQVPSAMLLAERGWASADVVNVLVGAASRHEGYAGTADDAAERLVAMGDEGVVPLLALLDNPQTPIKTRANLVNYSIASGVGTNARLTEWILAAASGQAPVEIQARAVYHLRKIADRPDDVRRALHVALASRDANVRSHAVSTWTALRLPPDPVVLRTLTDDDAETRHDAMALLPRLPVTDPDRLTAARRGLDDPNERVREAALEAVAAMGTDGADLLAGYLDRHELTYDFLNAINPPAFFRAERTPAPLTPRLVAALQRKAGTAESLLRLAVDMLLARGGAAASPDRTPLRDRLESADPRDRASAANALATMNEDLWSGDGRLLAVMIDTQVIKIVMERLGVALDDLYPPGFMLVSGMLDDLPIFPWPPPPGYSAIPLPRTMLSLGAAPTLGDVQTSLANALTAASKGFTQGLFRAPGGFALVARMERIGPDGTPLPGQARWMKEGSPTLSLLEFLGDLFFERPGYFRVVAFVLTNQPNPGSDPTARLPNPEEGGLVLPPALAQTALTDQTLLALVYSFERRGSALIQPWRDGSPSPREHLERAGIWSGFAVR